MKIDRANKRTISSTIDLPDVSEGVRMFFQKIEVGLITKDQIDGYTEESRRCVITQGVRQPFSSRQLVMKPEGQRGWSWSTLYCVSDLKIKLDDRIEILGVCYRVMSQTDWAEYGYISYDMIEDYRNAQ